MSTVRIAFKYIRYKICSKHKRGHGIHSPFVYHLIKNVFQDKNDYNEFLQIEDLKKRLLKNKTKIVIKDFGAGSKLTAVNTRTISKIAKHGTIKKKYGRLLFRLIKEIKATKIVELGTSLGISAMYLALSNPNAELYTIEGSSDILNVAEKNFSESGIKNIKTYNDNFDFVLPKLLAKLGNIDFAFVDGNHKKEATINYFKQLKRCVHNNSVIVFDDIHWSDEMEEAWNFIKADNDVRISIDIFFMGLVFFRKESSKQNFIINF